MEAHQHLAALARANRIRLARAALKRRVASGELSAAAVLRVPPEEAGSMTVMELLMSQRRWGRTRSRRAIVALGLPELKPVGALTPRQRERLAAILEGRPS